MSSSNTFVDRFGLWSDDQHAQARELVRRIDGGEVDLVRFAWPDQHGILRGKTLVASEARSALWEGVNLTSTLLAKDTSHKTVFPVFTQGGGFAIEGLQGGADITQPVRQLDELGLDFIAGLEVEFHVFKLDDARMGLADSGQPGEPPRVSLLSHGHQYLTELRYDRVDNLMELPRRRRAP
jgi:glutamine synthetase